MPAPKFVCAPPEDAQALVVSQLAQQMHKQLVTREKRMERAIAPKAQAEGGSNWCSCM